MPSRDRKSELVRKALGDHVFNAFIENKKIEWNQYRIHVSKYELDRTCHAIIHYWHFPDGGEKCAA